MSIAQRVEDALHSEAGLPTIVHDDTDDIRQESAALGRCAIEGQKHRGRHMQPVLAARYRTALLERCVRPPTR
jgi:hypothetical protein